MVGGTKNYFYIYIWGHGGAHKCVNLKDHRIDQKPITGRVSWAFCPTQVLFPLFPCMQHSSITVWTVCSPKWIVHILSCPSCYLWSSGHHPLQSLQHLAFLRQECIFLFIGQPFVHRQDFSWESTLGKSNCAVGPQTCQASPPEPGANLWSPLQIERPRWLQSLVWAASLTWARWCGPFHVRRITWV